jgi:hypothetical protein
MPHGEGSDGDFFFHLYSSPHLKLFLATTFSSLYPICCMGHPPSVNQGNKGTPSPSLPTSCGSDGKFPSCYYFFATIPFFLTAFFSFLLLFSWLRQLPSPSQSREQWPTTITSSHEVCGEGGDSMFSSCFFSTISIFSQHFF